MADGFELLARIPHDASAFTQGLAWLGPDLVLESTGLYGHSSLRRVRVSSGEVLSKRLLSADLFGEGIAILGSRVYQLTWQSGVAIEYGLDLTVVRTVRYEGEGWGLCRFGDFLMRSDGSEFLRVIRPDTFEVEETLEVRDHGEPLQMLNDLEIVGEQILANVWGRDSIAVIDRVTGTVDCWIDLSVLRPPVLNPQRAVLNGIAYDALTQTLYVTGKFWPLMYAVRVFR